MSDTALADLVTRSDKDGIATITLNRPEKRNAINRDLFRQFRRFIRDLESDSNIGVVIITGTGDHFCAGHDLTAPPHADALGWLRQELLILERLSKLRQPVIAKVRGTCFTGGLELALSADFIIAGGSARFADTHGKWGLVPGWGLSQRLPRRIGQAKALEMMLTCQPYDGQQAAAMGLANACVPDSELDAHVEALARMILANSWHSNAENKRLIYDTDGMTLPSGLNHELMRNAGFDTSGKDRREAFPGRSKP